MFKRITACTALCVLAFLLCSPLTAQADVVWDNNFAASNYEDLIDLGRDLFVINSGTGALTAKEAPGSRNDFITDVDWAYEYQNGQQIHLNKVYLHRGEYWGIRYYPDHRGTSGWFPMSQLLVVYERRDFNNENYGSFYEYTGDFDLSHIGDKFVAWQWPGSDSTKFEFYLENDLDSDDNIYYDRYSDGIELTNLIVHCAYTDEQGREWGFVQIEAYRYMHPEGAGLAVAERRLRTWDEWICLSDPSNLEGIPSFNPTPEPRDWSIEIGANDWEPGKDMEEYTAQSGQGPPVRTQGTGESQPSDDNALIYAIIGSGLLFLAAGVIIFVTIRRNRRRK